MPFWLPTPSANPLADIQQILALMPQAPADNGVAAYMNEVNRQVAEERARLMRAGMENSTFGASQLAALQAEGARGAADIAQQQAGRAHQANMDRWRMAADIYETTQRYKPKVSEAFDAETGATAKPQAKKTDSIGSRLLNFAIDTGVRSIPYVAPAVTRTVKNVLFGGINPKPQTLGSGLQGPMQPQPYNRPPWYNGGWP